MNCELLAWLTFPSDQRYRMSSFTHRQTVCEAEEQKQAGVHRGDGDGGCNYPVKSDESNKRCGLACALAFGRLHPDAALLAACRVGEAMWICRTDFCPAAFCSLTKDPCSRDDAK